MILLLDNRDSFTFNLAQVLMELGAEVRVERSDEITTDAIRALEPAGILVGPGPGVPADAGISERVVRDLSESVPILGVCLGHQALATAWGGELVRARELVHGMTREVTHDGRGVFRGLPSPVALARYNSLTVEESSLPDQLEVSARGPEGEIMGLRHRRSSAAGSPRWLEGVQFHPESVLCIDSGGRRILANFLRESAATAAGTR